MYLTPYEQTASYFGDKLVLEYSYDSAQLLIDGDIITTFRGKEACRQRPDNSVVFTVPHWRGQRWLRLFGGRLGVTHTSRRVWKGGVETHSILHRGDAFERLVTTKHVCGKTVRNVSYDLEIYVPDDSRPRLRTLTDVGERQVKEAIEKLVEDVTHSSVLQALKGATKTSGYCSINYQYGFEILYNRRSLEYVQNTTVDDVVKSAKKRKYWIANKINAECEYSKL
jgi:hypothetical protein